MKAQLFLMLLIAYSNQLYAADVTNREKIQEAINDSPLIVERLA
jgi:hypothetical protein